ncbi:MAG: DEAD/DEAH box helicase [Candidatus Gastranaerophilales bacterium]|nr:DEAD/DEAH box helicase [Candidatus Gastranaerophilales bacterium]
MITDQINDFEEEVSSFTFDELNLSSEILSAIAEMKFTTPSSIQKEAIPRVLNHEDIIAQAPTGSGKTAAYAIPVLEKINKNSTSIQSLILCPTRELVIQVHKEFEKLTKYMESIKVVSVYGGQNIEKQFNALKKNPQIVVATPGRLMDHLRRNSISLKDLSIVVLDEADEMLDMGFREDIYTILEDTPENRQTVLFSATMAKDIIALTKKFQKTPFIIDVRDNLLNAPNIAQYYLEVVEKEKPELITRLLELHNLKLVLIFCNTKSNVDKLVEILKSKGYFADSLHGDMNQVQREKVMKGFKNGSVKILVATDVAGRGIDVKNVQCVFNYDLPRDDEDYIHRIGRTARAGKSGIAFSLISKRQASSLKRIERANGLKIEKADLPSVTDISNAKFVNFSNEIKEMIQSNDLTTCISQINSLVDENNSLLEIAAALLKNSLKREAMKINKKIEFTEEEYDDSRESKRASFPRHRNRNSKPSFKRNDKASSFKPKFSGSKKGAFSGKRKRSK